MAFSAPSRTFRLADSREPVLALAMTLGVYGLAQVLHGYGFIAVFVAALVVGALVAWPLRAVVRKAGMGFLDASLGATFGLVRGMAIMVAFALVAGVTGIAQRDWWQNAFLAPSLGSAAMALRPWLPHDWAERLDFSATGPAPVAPAQPGKT
jgi:uncharacterized membrane protein required for colicin V production